MLIISVFHSVPLVPRKKMGRFGTLPIPEVSKLRTIMLRDYVLPRRQNLKVIPNKKAALFLKRLS